MTADWDEQSIERFAQRVRRINTAGADLPVLSVTKHNGVVLQSERFNKRIATDLRKYQLARRGEFVFDPMSLYYGAIGRLRVVAEGVVSPDYVVFAVDDSVDGDFLRHLFRWSRMHAVYDSLSERGNRFGKRMRLYWSVFERINVRLPPLPEQRKIAAVLSSVDEVIEKTQVVIDQIHSVKTSMMAELLTRGRPGRHRRIKKTELGEIPAEWELTNLGGVLRRIDAGWSPRCDSRPAAADEWGVIRVSAVSWGRFREGENKKLAAGLEPRPELAISSGDVLLSRANTTELVGRPVLVEDCRPKLMLSDKTLRLVPTERVDAMFLVTVLQSLGARRYFESAATGSSTSMKNVSQAKLKSFRFALPSLEEQKEIAAIARGCDDRLLLEEGCLAETQSLKRALTSALLTGSTRVRGAEPDQ